MEDQQIVALYNQRSEAAIAATATKYGAYCLKIAKNILSDPQDQEECVNDTWLRTWNSIPPQQPGNLRLYLARIVRNLSLDRYRTNHRQKREPFGTVLEELGDVADKLSAPETALAEKELVVSISQYLRTLSQRERDIFIRRYYYAEETQVIGKVWGISNGLVLRMLSRTRQKLRKHLEKEGYII